MLLQNQQTKYNLHMSKLQKIKTTKQLIHALLKQYNICKSDTTDKPQINQSQQLSRLKWIYEQKSRQYQSLQKSYHQVHQQNNQLKIKISHLQAERNLNEDSQQVIRLKQKLAQYEMIFKQEEMYVEQLKEMLDNKEREVQTLVERYESKIDSLMEQLQLPEQKNKSVLEYQQEIKQLNALLKQQEQTMLELFEANKKLEAMKIESSQGENLVDPDFVTSEHSRFTSK